MTSPRGGSEGESPAVRDQHPTDQDEVRLRAQFAKHLGEVASQSRTKTKQAKPETETKRTDTSNEL